MGARGGRTDGGSDGGGQPVLDGGEVLRGRITTPAVVEYQSPCWFSGTQSQEFRKSLFHLFGKPGPSKGGLEV